MSGESPAVRAHNTARPGRAEVIAAIHAAADWLTEHPEIPIPRSVAFSARLESADIPDEGDRMRFLMERAAAMAGTTVTETATGLTIVTFPPVDDVSVTYYLTAVRDEMPRTSLLKEYGNA